MQLHRRHHTLPRQRWYCRSKLHVLMYTDCERLHGRRFLFRLCFGRVGPIETGYLVPLKPRVLFHPAESEPVLLSFFRSLRIDRSADDICESDGIHHLCTLTARYRQRYLRVLTKTIFTLLNIFIPTSSGRALSTPRKIHRHAISLGNLYRQRSASFIRDANSSRSSIPFTWLPVPNASDSKVPSATVQTVRPRRRVCKLMRELIC